MKIGENLQEKLGLTAQDAPYLETILSGLNGTVYTGKRMAGMARTLINIAKETQNCEAAIQYFGANAKQVLAKAATRERIIEYCLAQPGFPALRQVQEYRASQSDSSSANLQKEKSEFTSQIRQKNKKKKKVRLYTYRPANLLADGTRYQHKQEKDKEYCRVEQVAVGQDIRRSEITDVDRRTEYDIRNCLEDELDEETYFIDTEFKDAQKWFRSNPHIEFPAVELFPMARPKKSNA